MTKRLTRKQVKELASELSSLLSKDEDTEFRNIQGKLRTQLSLYSLDLLQDAFAFANHHRDERSPANNIAVRAIVAVLDHMFERFDEAGLNEFFCSVAPRYKDFNFEYFPYVLGDEIRIAHQASVFGHELFDLFSCAEKNKAELLARCDSGDFRFSENPLSSIPAYPGPGSSWGELFRFVAGGAIAVTNVVATPVTGGLAVASVAIGAACVGEGLYIIGDN